MPALTPAQDAEAYARRNNGETQRAIAAAMGVTRAQVNHGITRHARRNSLPDPAARRSVAAAANYARAAGLAFDEAAIAAAVTTTTATSIIPTRTFGIEIEFRRPNSSLTPAQIATALRAAGLNAQEEGYNHQTRNYWKLIHDASSDRELVSPPLSGPEGLAEVRTAMRVLRELGCYISSSEGMHVHVYAGDVDPTTVANVFGFYAHRQRTVFDNLVSRSRRGTARWCQGVSVRDFERTMDYARRGTVSAVNGRYVTVNLDAYRRQRTVEFRQHQGSLNGRKACDWIELMLAVVQYVADGGPAAPTSLDGTLAALVGGNVLRQASADRLLRKAAGYGWVATPVPAASPTTQSWDGCDCAMCVRARSL